MSSTYERMGEVLVLSKDVLLSGITSGAMYEDVNGVMGITVYRDLAPGNLSVTPPPFHTHELL